ncbi:hypothetical protein DMENIID0001_072790 [Sergentomyia squamirostris]
MLKALVLSFAISVTMVVILAQDSGFPRQTLGRPFVFNSSAFRSCRVQDKILEHGQDWTNNERCIVFFCYDGAILDVGYCNDIEIDKPNCVIIPIRTNLDYPDCCPKVVCD